MNETKAYDTDTLTRRTIRRYRVSDIFTKRTLVVVEAANEEEAATRCEAVAPILGFEIGILGVALKFDIHEEDEPLIVPFFADGFFLMRSAAESTKH